MTVEFDTTKLEAGIRALVAGIGRQSGDVAERQAADVARQLRDRIPVRTGRLRATVTVTAARAGASVHYGGDLPYANYIDGRTNAVEESRAGSARAFFGDMTAMAAKEIRRL